jgi:hypothetical protein
LWRAQAKIKFDTSILAVTGIVNKLAVVDRRLTRVTDNINTMCYDNNSTDEDDGAVDSTDLTAGAAKALEAQNEAKLLEAHQSKREQLTTEQQHLQQQLFKYFDQTLGGWSAMSKHDKQKLSLPKINKQMTARDITDAFKAYTSHRAAEYYAILPYINYIAESYNPEDGTYAEAPDKERKYDAVPKCLQPAYDLQPELIFREILSCIGQAEMAKITSTFRCGVNKQEKARTAVGDGVAAFRNLLSKHGKNDAYYY